MDWFVEPVIGCAFVRSVGRNGGKHRSAYLTLLFSVAAARLCRLERTPERLSAINRSMIWPRIWVPKGLAMLIRSEKVGVSGGAAIAARPDAIPAACLPTLLLGGLLLLIGP
jgi:hypothetical protein